MVEHPTPIPTSLLSAEYSQFDNVAVIKNATAFSSVARIDTVYKPVVFTSDVDLTDKEALKTFITNNIPAMDQVDFVTPIDQWAVGSMLNEQQMQRIPL